MRYIWISLSWDGVKYHNNRDIRDLKQQGRECERQLLRKITLVSGLLFTSLCRSLEFSFFALNFVNRKPIKCFFYEAKQILRKFCCYVLIVPTTLKKVFSHCNSSENFVQVQSWMYSNMKLLYLLLFFAIVVGIAVLIA